MSPALPPLPTDFAELQAFAASLRTENLSLKNWLQERDDELKARDNELYAKTLHIEKLKIQLAVQKRARFGQSAEKLAGESEQLELEIEDREASLAVGLARKEAEAARRSGVDARKERAQPVRKPLPDHLPRERVEHPATCICPECGGRNLTRIGTDEREVLEYVPSHFKVIVHVRPKMSCRDCETITQPPMPSLPIERGIPGPGLLAHVLVSKYADHLPLYRQSEIYERDGIDIDRSTMCGWVGRTSFLLEPMAEEIARYVREGEVLHADDTRLPVLEPGRGRTRTGRLWVAVRDERTWGSRAPPAVFYRYSPNRQAKWAWALLQDCRGYLHADAYSGFKKLYEQKVVRGNSQMLEVACWAHARRKIFEVHKAAKSEAARVLVERIDDLFAIEADIRGLPPEERLDVRQKYCIPLLAELKTEFEKILSRISGKSEFAKALRYSLSRWEAMTRYTTDGRLEICNNAAERAIRPLALGRKNWLFAGNDGGGECAATIYTLAQTAKLNGIDPEAYLRAVIGRIADHPNKRIADLLPWNIVL